MCSEGYGEAIRQYFYDGVWWVEYRCSACGVKYSVQK
jgi:hypothetical protein